MLRCALKSALPQGPPGEWVPWPKERREPFPSSGSKCAASGPALAGCLPAFLTQLSLPAQLAGDPDLPEFQARFLTSTLTSAHDCARGSPGLSAAVQRGKDLALVTQL